MLDYGDDYINKIKLVAYSTTLKRRVSASNSTKEDGPFVDQETNEEVIVRKCSYARDHFAFKSIYSDIVGARESELHSACKEEICKSLQAKFRDGSWDTEYRIPFRDTYLQADTAGRIDRKPVVIEVQASTYTIPKIEQKTKNYMEKGCYVLWLIPLKSKLPEDRFRPRLFEQYLHGLYYGRIYYWLEGMGSMVIPVHFEPAYTHIEYREWYDTDGELSSAGGYDKRLKLTKSPVKGQLVDIGENFQSHHRSFKPIPSKKYDFPECLIYRDSLPIWWKGN